MSISNPPDRTKAHRPAKLILQIAAAVYLYLILENLINGLFARLGSQPGFTYRPETPADGLYFFFGLIVSLLPLVALVFILKRSRLSIYRLWQQEAIATMAILPFVWLFIASSIRSLLSLVLWFSQSSSSIIEMLILAVQLSLLVVIIGCWAAAFVLRRKRRPSPSKSE